MSSDVEPITYLVLGDLGGGRYIVRMFVDDQTFDDHVEARLDELHETVLTRRDELAANPDPKLLAEAARPDVHPGHAVELS